MATLTASRGYDVNKVRMCLSAEQYDLAIQVHRAGTLVTVVGDLVDIPEPSVGGLSDSDWL